MSKELNLNPLMILILKKLEEKSRTGYELKSLLATYWQASHQQVYRELDKLAVAELATVKVEPQSGKPDRKVYTLTNKGVTALKARRAESGHFKMSPVRGDAVPMLVAGSECYFVEAAGSYQSAIAELENRDTSNETDIERLIMERKIKTYAAELDFAQMALEQIRGKSA